MDRREPSGDGSKNVLFVCTANICRSPIAEAIFDALASDKGIPYESHSAGTAALVGEPIAPHARAALEEVGVYTDGHRARQVDAAMLEEADLVLAMTPRHVETLRRISTVPPEKIRTLIGYANGTPDLEGIPDPYGQTMAAYRASVRQIFECVDRLVSKLKNDRTSRSETSRS
ncbi:MAG: low molecular weight phosphatase family protein [Actinomycetota bacterium]|nr:low molecular weight phosphatase family protein [Actinomycetota bacterium]